MAIDDGPHAFVAGGGTCQENSGLAESWGMGFPSPGWRKFSVRASLNSGERRIASASSESCLYHNPQSFRVWRNHLCPLEKSMAGQTICLVRVKAIPDATMCRGLDPLGLAQPSGRAKGYYPAFPCPHRPLADVRSSHVSSDIKLRFEWSSGWPAWRPEAV